MVNLDLCCITLGITNTWHFHNPTVWYNRHLYVDLEVLVHLAIKVEGQLKRKGNTRSGAYTGSSSGWKMNYRREGSASSKPLVTFKVVEPTSMKKQVSTNDKKT